MAKKLSEDLSATDRYKGAKFWEIGKRSRGGKGGLASSLPTMISIQGKVTSMGSLGELATCFLWLADTGSPRRRKRERLGPLLCKWCRRGMLH